MNGLVYNRWTFHQYALLSWAITYNIPGPPGNVYKETPDTRSYNLLGN